MRDHHMLNEVVSVAKKLIASDPRSARAIVDRWIASPDEFSQA
jgi:hypothetical protein